MSNFTASASFILDHARRRLARRANEARWKRETKPFWFKGARGLKFELVPGEHVDHYIFTEGLYEKRFLFLVERLFKGSRVALDVGANIGNHALFFSRIFRQVHAFEPNPTTLKRLHRNIGANGVANIVVHPFGLSDENNVKAFQDLSGVNAGASRIVESSGANLKTIEVKRGDDVIEARRLKGVDFIKVDVEGHEIAVLEGLKATIARDQPAVAFEFHPSQFDEGYFVKFEQALPGYAFFECDIRGPGGFLADMMAFLKLGGLPRVARLTDATKGTYENILALPPSRMDLLKKINSSA
jgi:FkbM family methyltransferase